MKTTLREAVGRAYSSSANLGAGFDTFGLALDKYSDTVSVRLTQERKVKIVAKGVEARKLPLEIEKNSAGPPAHALLERAHSTKGLVITIDKKVPPGLGLGSSAATAAATTKALDHILDLRLSDNELVRVASLGEKAVAGTAHADNVAASLIGGFVAVYDDPPKTISFKPPPKLKLAVATPQLSIQENKTRKARKLVPRTIETRKAVMNIGRASAIVAGFARGDVRTIGSAMRDEIAEPHRRALIPGYDDVKRLALDAGAAGVAISGAGPSMISLVDGTIHDPRAVVRAMVRGFALNRVPASGFVSRPAPGAQIIRSC